jgi:hypothetical protein
MKLHWQSIVHYKELAEVEKSMNETKKYSGIYIWGFRNKEGFMPYYVGKEEEVCDRLCEHLNYLKGGAYTIYTEDALFDIENDKPIYRPDSVKKRIQFVADEYPEPALQEHVDFMINNFYFTYAPMSYDEFKNYGADAERVMLNWLKEIISNTRIGKNNTRVIKGNIVLVGNKYLKVL